MFSLKMTKKLLCLATYQGSEGSSSADIAADMAGKQGFESHLATLTRKKEDLQKRIDANKQWTVCTPIICLFVLRYGTTYAVKRAASRAA